MGLGWTLNAGGAITRSVIAAPDDQPLGVLYRTFPEHDGPGEHFPCFLAGLARPEMAYDGQQDAFFYNLGGTSGKFIFKNLKATGTPWEIATIPYTPVKIVPHPLFEDFTITDLDGATYVFGQEELSTVADQYSNIRTAWYLTKIISSDKSDTVSFTYTEPTPVMSVQSGNSLSERDDFTFNLPGRVTYSKSATVSTHYSVNIAEITFNNGKVAFEYATDRLDVSGARRLNAVKIFEKDNGSYSEVKRFTLIQNYFTATGAQKTLVEEIIPPSQYPDLINKRLRLDSIAEEGFRNGASIKKPPYTFGYETGPFPVYATTAQDFMGFYNGKHSNQHLLFFDMGNDAYGYRISTEFGANRNVDPAFIKAGSLKRVNYPTGGFTDFELEPNQITYEKTVVTPTYQTYDYLLTSQDLSHYQETITITSAMADSTGRIEAVFKVNSINNIPNEPVLSTTVSVFDVTANAYANMLVNTFPGQAPAQIAIPANSTTINVIETLELLVGHTYTFTYGSGLPVSNNRIYTSISWKVQTGSTSSVVNTTDYTGGLRIKSVKSDDGNGNVTKKQYAYTKWYYNSNLYTGDLYQVAYFFKSRSSRFAAPSGGNASKYWYNNYGENVTFQLGSTMNTVAAYEEVEEISVDSEGNDLGKTVSVYNKAVDQIPSMTPFFRSDESWKRGQLARQKIYKRGTNNDLVLLKEVINEYDDDLLFTVKGYWASLYEEGPLEGIIQVYAECINVPVGNFYRWQDIDQPVYTSNLISTNTIQYDEQGNNPTSVLVEYEYGNPKHQQLTRTSQGTSTGKVLQKDIKYPLDYSIGNCVIDDCYTTYNAAIASLLVTKENCESTYYSEYETHVANNNTAAANTAFANYLGCSSTYQDQISQTVVPNLNACRGVYTDCVNSAIAAANDRDKSLLMMQRDNFVNTVVENTSGYSLNNIEYITAADRTDFRPVTTGTTMPDIIWGFKSLTPVVKSTFESNPSSYYRKLGSFIAYDEVNNVLEKQKDKDVTSSYIWDYGKEYPIAEVSNASVTEIAYTSFESDGTGNWEVSNSSRNEVESRVGKRSYQLSYGSISKSSLGNGKVYQISFWAKSGEVSVNGTSLSPASTAIDGWQYFETSVTGSPTVTSVVISGAAFIDELRFHPIGAQMSTYTYIPMVGLTSMTDANNLTTYYEYDELDRLKVIKDDKGNVLRSYKYHYALDAQAGQE